MSEAKLMQNLASKIEEDLFKAICGPVRKQPQTALRFRAGAFETVELDSDGKVIEPEPRCFKCGPIFLCSKHFVCT